jgi:threonine dehydrogenase-like Zn-dependent dehydrogenase
MAHGSRDHLTGPHERGLRRFVRDSPNFDQMSTQVRLPLAYVQDHELMLTGAFRYANTWPTAIQLVASGRVDLDSLVTGHYGLHDVEAALTASRSDPTTVKAIVRPGD